MAETEAYGDRYRIIERIGDGGSSVVYRALDTRLGVEVALKVVHTDASREDTLRARLRTEAETMMRLSHPNILQVYAVGEDAGWIAMDLSEQGSLSDHVGEHGPLAPRRAIRVVLQLLAAIKVAHEHGVVHRDVKPENLLLQPDGSIKLCDFGIALVQDETRVTRAGFAMGSLPYMAPEQRVDPGKVGSSADLYSIGATLYFLITGSTPVDLFLAPPSSPRFAGLPEGLVEIIRKATSADPAERYPDADAMIDALTPCLELAADKPVVRETNPAAAPRVRTVTVPPEKHDDGVAKLEAELHRQWRVEEDQRVRQSAANNKRVAMMLGLSVLLLVLGAATVVAIEDWLDERQRVQGLEEAEIVGDWAGTFGTHTATLELRGSHGALVGTLQLRNREARSIAGAVTGGRLILVDQDTELKGQYRAELVDGGRLDGDYVTTEGRWPFHFVRVD